MRNYKTFAGFEIIKKSFFKKLLNDARSPHAALLYSVKSLFFFSDRVAATKGSSVAKGPQKGGGARRGAPKGDKKVPKIL